MRAWIGLGANTVGPWGRPAQSVARAVHELRRVGLDVRRVSRLYDTAPVGGPRQPRYRNAVVEIEAGLAPAALLRRFKQIERAAGRRRTGLWTPRPLDLDLLLVGAPLSLGWRRPRRKMPNVSDRSLASRRHAGVNVPPGLILPHARLHERLFALLPLLDVAPAAIHPVLGLPLRRLAHGLRRSGVRRSLDPWPFSCD